MAIQQQYMCLNQDNDALRLPRRCHVVPRILCRSVIAEHLPALSSDRKEREESAMQIGGAIWTGSPLDPVGKNQPCGGWELESANFVAARAGLQLARLRASRASGAELDRAERRYRNALQLLQRIRAGLNDSSTAQ